MAKKVQADNDAPAAAVFWLAFAVGGNIGLFVVSGLFLAVVAGIR